MMASETRKERSRVVSCQLQMTACCVLRVAPSPAFLGDLQDVELLGVGAEGVGEGEIAAVVEISAVQDGPVGSWQHKIACG
jgi:hypothetical protein